MFNAKLKTAAIASLIAVAGMASAQAQEKTLKLAHGYPATHFLWEHGVKLFIDDVTKSTDGQVEFEVYPANQLGKDPIILLNTGLADMALITPAIAGGKLALTAVTELPGLYESSCEATGKFWEIAKEGGILNENEYKALGLHVIYVATVPPYSLMTVSKATPDLDALKGLKVRTAGGAMNKTVSALGGVPLQLPGAEMYDALTRGTIDGTIYSRMALPSLKLEGVMKHGVDGVRLGAGSVVLAMTEKAWKALPENVRASMEASSKAAQKAACTWSDEQETAMSKTLVEKNGWTITSLSPEQVDLWNGHIAKVNADWAVELDSSGRKGTETLEAFTKAVPAE